MKKARLCCCGFLYINASGRQITENGRNEKQMRISRVKHSRHHQCKPLHQKETRASLEVAIYRSEQANREGRP